jgi:ABC-type Fe3+-siderophore transport system permease subunit
LPLSLSTKNATTYVIWIILLSEILTGLATSKWSLAAIGFVTFLLTLLPVMFSDRFAVKLPVSFVSMIVIFIFATIFLGEAANFYEQYWWWDILLHGGSAIGFGLLSFLFVFMLFEGDRYSAPPIAIALITFSCAIAIGVIWEILEYAADQLFGLNMQKSGLHDTMWDLIVDCIGASLAGWAGFFYLKGKELGGLTSLIDEFIGLNKKFFHKLGEAAKPKGNNSDKS